MSGALADWPPRFTIDQEQVLNLFIGEGFYSSADASLREAILNAIDACGRRGADDSEFVRHIVVKFDRERMLVSIDDNGDGMGQDEIANLFAKVGASASRLLGVGGMSVWA
jgi:HSP90 family molecular chaperone